MALEILENIGATGIVSDIDPKKLPTGVWSAGQNVRFDGYTATKAGGSRVIYGSLSTSAYSLFYYDTSEGTHRFVYAGLTRVFSVAGATHHDLTRVTTSGTAELYNATQDDLWTGGVLGGLLFLNNGVDHPQIQVTPTASAKLSNLPNWPTTITTRCSSLRAFKSFLVALDVTSGTTRYRQRVMWSSSTDPLTVPATWDPSVTTQDAGFADLTETNGNVIDCLPLRDVNIVYKDDSVWGMQYIGGQFIFRFYQIFKDVGILARRCVAAFEQYHCFIGNDLDIYVHDGNNLRSIAQDKWRNWLRTHVDAQTAVRSFAVPNPATTEIWLCFPTGDDDHTTQVLMWNWRKDTWGVRTVSNVSSGVVGVINSADYVPTWATVMDTWDGITLTWNEIGAIPTDRRLLLASPTRTTGLIETEYSVSEFGAALPFSLERQGMWLLPMAGKADLQGVMFVRRVRFRVGGSSAADITYSVAVQTDMGSAITYASTVKALNGTAEVNVFKRGRFISIKAESAEDVVAVVHSVEIEVEPSGRYL